MNGVKGIMVKCRYCGREIFLRAIAIEYTAGENEEPYEKIMAYDSLPYGWCESLMGDPICPKCRATKIHGHVDRMHTPDGENYIPFDDEKDFEFML